MLTVSSLPVAAVVVLLAVATNGFVTPTSLTVSSSSTTTMVSSSSSSSSSCLQAIDAPFGAWESPLTSKAITAGSVSMGSLKLDSNNNLLWLEGRPQEGGRYVLCRYDPTSPDKSERNAVDVTPKDSNVRTRVHEYGGGAVTLGREGDIFYSDFATQRVMKLSQNNNNNKGAPLTPDCEGCRYRFADGDYDAHHSRIVMIREDHTHPAPKDVVNEIVSVVDAKGESTPKVLATGRDFYASPRLSPDGKQLAYVTWNHPNMPWDASELRVVTLQENANVPSTDTDTHTLLAGADGDTSILQPQWHPLTNELFYISDETGYYNIYKVTTTTTTTTTTTPVLPMDYDFGGSSPGWSLGQQGYGFLNDGRLYATYQNDGETRLVVVDVMNSNGQEPSIQEYGTSHGLPMQFGGIVASPENVLYFVGGSPSTPTSIFQWSLDDDDDNDDPTKPAKQLACSSTLVVPENVISIPQHVEFPTNGNNRTAHGYYYPPCNGKYHCTTESAPPLLVKAHGGPTACTSTSFHAGIQYWTSRGFAVLDVDYGGSTGYGRDYRRRLRGSWGIVDVDDVCAGAHYLVQQGRAHPQRLCIDGGSAGGYTTLCALTFRNVFTAGCSLYGIGDLSMLAGDTHKFESRYLDGLVGKYPQEEAIYKERSPIEHVEQLNCPILLLQGVEDKVVPPNQAKSMHQALLKKGLPSCLKLYEGEQHGFRQAKNIEDALDSELAFYGKVFGIPIPHAVDIQIDNL